MPPKKIILKTEAETGFILAGLVTPLPSYRIAWYVNNSLYLQLKKTDDAVISDYSKSSHNIFARYWYNESITKSEFFLLENKSDGSLILPELKEMDYLLMIKGNYYLPHQNEVVKKLLKIKPVQTVVLLNVAKLKSGNNLMELSKISNAFNAGLKHL